MTPAVTAFPAESATDWAVLRTSEDRVHVEAADAEAALGTVCGLAAPEALARLRFGPGRTCEPVARVLDIALASAGRAGIQPARLVLVEGSARPGQDLLRESRKLGAGSWFSRPTATVSLTLQPAGTRPAAPRAFQPAAEPSAAAPAVTAAGTRTVEPEPGSAAEAVREALYDVLDPDLGVNIVDLGFIRGIGLDEAGIVSLTMTLTSAACPLTGITTDQINRVLVDEPEAPAKGVHIEWAWTPGDSSAEGREQLRAIGFTRF